jgi:hypothetical protein
MEGLASLLVPPMPLLVLPLLLLLDPSSWLITTVSLFDAILYQIRIECSRTMLLAVRE